VGQRKPLIKISGFFVLYGLPPALSVNIFQAGYLATRAVSNALFRHKKTRRSVFVLSNLRIK